MSTQEQRPGTLVVDRYLVRREAGRGMRAIVYEAYDIQLHRVVALKCALGSSAAPALLLEAQRLARVHSPYVVQIHDVLPTEVPALVLEWLPGRTLRATLGAGRPDRRELDCLVRHLLAALEASHAASVVHGDVKPENISSHPSEMLKLFDFGAAPQAGDATPLYAAPEVMRGQTPDPGADLYAAGCVVFELLTGRTPFDGVDVRELGERKSQLEPPSLRASGGEVDPGLEAWVARAIARRPEERFGSAREAAQAWQAATASSQPARTRNTPHAEHLERLRALVPVVGARRGVAVAVSGTSGLGKTRLLALLEHELEASGQALLRVNGTSPLGRAYSTWNQAALSHRSRTLQAPSWSDDVDGHAVLRALEGFIRQTPGLVILVDAFECCDPVTQRLVVLLAQRAAALACDVVVACNDRRLGATARDHWCALVDVSAAHIPLQHLKLQHIRPLVCERLGAGNVSDTLVAFVLAHSSGNPRFACLLLDDLRATGALESCGDAWVFHRHKAPDRLVRAPIIFVEQRLAGLLPEARALLQEAALQGDRFSAALIAERMHTNHDAVVRDLHRLALHDDVIAPDGNAYRFVEPLLRDYFYALCPAVERVRAHHQLADILLAGDDVEAEAVGTHLFLAGEHDRAVPHLAQAARAALEGRDILTAHRVLEMACAQPSEPQTEELALQQVDLALAYADVLQQLAAWEPVGQVLEHAQLVAKAWGLQTHEVRAARARGRVEYLRGHYDTAIERYSQARDCAARAGDALEHQELALQIGNIHFERGSLDRALEAYSDVLLFAAEHEHTDLEARAENNVALVESSLGHKSEAVRLFARSLELFRALGREDAVARTLHNIGMAYFELSNWAAARNEFEACMDMAHKLGLDDLRAIAGLQHAEASIRLGQLEAAAGGIEQALAICRERNDPIGMATAYRLQGLLAVSRQDHVAATQKLRQSLDVLQPLGDTPYLAQVYRELGRILLDAADTAGARLALVAAQRIVSKLDIAPEGVAELQALWDRCQQGATCRQ